MFLISAYPGSDAVMKPCRMAKSTITSAAFGFHRGSLEKNTLD